MPVEPEYTTWRKINNFINEPKPINYRIRALHLIDAPPDLLQPFQVIGCQSIQVEDWMGMEVKQLFMVCNN